MYHLGLCLNIFFCFDFGVVKKLVILNLNWLQNNSDWNLMRSNFDNYFCIIGINYIVRLAYKLGSNVECCRLDCSWRHSYFQLILIILLSTFHIFKSFLTKNFNPQTTTQWYVDKDDVCSRRWPFCHDERDVERAAMIR